MITVETIIRLIEKQRDNSTYFLNNIIIPQLNEGKITEDDFGLVNEMAKERVLNWILQDIYTLIGEKDGI